jgi:colicin import membrane protein
MSAIVYREPYQLPAGILALAVHGAFFSLLYFGFTWQTQPAGTMSVELWQSLPDTAVASPAKRRVEEVVQPPPEKIIKPDAIQPSQPEEIVEPDIVLPDKKKVEAKPAEQKRTEQKPDTSIADQQAARERAAQAAAVGRIVDEYTGKITGKIRRNIVMPPNVADDARAEFSVTLLPGGAVLSARLTRSSGNAVYDNAVERAILKSQPLPLPADVTMFNRFRELKLVFRPVE